MDYGKRIYELRRKEDISQEALAAALGTTRTQVSRWECGISIPSTKFVRALADYFHCSVNDIFGEDIGVEEHNQEEKSSSASFHNLAIGMCFFFGFLLFAAAIVSALSNEISQQLHYAFGALRDAGVSYDPATVNTAIRVMGEKICSYSFVGLIVGSVIGFACLLTIYLFKMKGEKNKIVRYELTSSLLLGTLFFVATIVAGWLVTIVGQHVSYLRDYTFGLFDAALYFMAALYAGDVLITFLSIVLRKRLSGLMVMLPWVKRRRIFDIIYISIGLPACIIFIIFGSMHPFTFLFFGFVFFPTAVVFLISHLIVRNITSSDKE